MKKIKEFWASLEDETIISKRELFLALVTCTLAGIVAGVFLSPKKNVEIGSNNGSNNSGCRECGDIQDYEEDSAEV